MTKDEWEALDVQTYGLTPDLFVPIAASDLASIEKYVGTITHQLNGRARAVNAVVVKAHRPERDHRVPLWSEIESERYYRILHPQRQLWVHVNYSGYRRAWERLGFGKLDSATFLDHIHNREAARLNHYRQPFLRLCPVSRATNTSGGLNSGAEGMQKTELRIHNDGSDRTRKIPEERLHVPIVLADPIDMTKMFDIPPGLGELRGVAKMLMKFYV